MACLNPESLGILNLLHEEQMSTRLHRNHDLQRQNMSPPPHRTRRSGGGDEAGMQPRLPRRLRALGPLAAV